MTLLHRIKKRFYSDERWQRYLVKRIRRMNEDEERDEGVELFGNREVREWIDPYTGLRSDIDTGRG